MEAALAEFATLSSNWTIQEADWSKVRGLSFRDALGERDRLAQELGFIAVDTKEPDFEPLVGDFHSFS